ncbi:MAG: polyprenyl synthetase family protein [Gemmatimonadota bacterium]|jgi:octaprenyl-diphosphate synthase
MDDVMLRAAPPKLAQIQRPVRDRLSGVVGELRRIVLTDFPPIEGVNEHLLVARGKLFRPTLLLLANELGERRHPKAVTLAAAVELVHLATLVHDDSVDHSVLRRGMPTVNALWNHQTAVIMGDYLYSRAVSELAEVGKVELIRILSQAANDMSVGEMRQLVSSDALEYTEAEYYRLIECKTASLMSAACAMGALSDAEQWREPLARFGRHLGMAFQIADDMLDYTQTEAVLGKPAGQDLREHKVTLPLIAALRKMDGPSRREVEAFFADPEPSDDGIANVIALVLKHGGLDYALQQAQHFGDQAQEALEGVPAGPVSDALHLAIEYVVDRRR